MRSMQRDMRYSEAKAVGRIAYRREGNGPPLVLLHGFISDSRVWRTQIAGLREDFDVVAWDAPGCGASDDPPEDFTMSQFAESLRELLDHAGIASAHLLGLSWGGTLALEFNRRFPARTRTLIIADSYAGWTGSLGAEAAAERLERSLRASRRPPAEWLAEWLPGMFSARVPPDVRDELGSIMQDLHPVGFRAMSRAVTPDFSDALPEVRCPTLLLWGDEDARSPVTCGEMMQQRIASARLVVIPGAGHVSNMEQPERFNVEVKEFLKGR